MRSLMLEIVGFAAFICGAFVVSSGHGIAAVGVVAFIVGVADDASGSA